MEKLENGACKCSSARKQTACDEAVTAPLDAMRWLEERLSNPRHLTGGTIRMHHIVQHDHYSHESINPNRSTPVNPVISWTRPHGRGRISQSVPPTVRNVRPSQPDRRAQPGYSGTRAYSG